MQREQVNYVLSKKRSLMIRLISSFLVVVLIVVLAILIPSLVI